jgi:hypothetical protein
MRLKLALLTTALAFGLGVPAALAEDAPGAKSDITIAGATADQPPATQDEESQAAPDAGAPPAQDDGGAAIQQEPPKSDENSGSNY